MSQHDAQITVSWFFGDSQQWKGFGEIGNVFANFTVDAQLTSCIDVGVVRLVAIPLGLFADKAG